MPLSFDLLRLIFYAALNAAVLRLVSSASAAATVSAAASAVVVHVASLAN